MRARGALRGLQESVECLSDVENEMASILLPAGIRVSLEFDIQGKVVVNVYHVTTTDPIITVKLLQIAQMFADWWTADLATRFSHDIALFQVVAQDLSIANGEKQTLTLAPAEQGVITAPALPNNVAYVVSHKTAKTGRSFMGRSYLCGIDDAGVVDNEITVGKAANIVSDFNELVTGLNTIATELVVASFVSGGAPRAVGVATPIDTIAMNRRVDTQRRRLPR